MPAIYKVKSWLTVIQPSVHMQNKCRWNFVWMVCTWICQRNL